MHTQGVCWDETVWKARLMRKHLGRFATEEEAARAYDAAARDKLENPILNFLPDGSLNPDRKRRGGASSKL